MSESSETLGYVGVIGVLVLIGFISGLYAGVIYQDARDRAVIAEYEKMLAANNITTVYDGKYAVTQICDNGTEIELGRFTPEELKALTKNMSVNTTYHISKKVRPI